MIDYVKPIEFFRADDTMALSCKVRKQRKPMVYFVFSLLAGREQTGSVSGGMKLDMQYDESQMIEMIVEEKNRKQRQIMDLDTVDDEGLLNLIREIKDETLTKTEDESKR